MTDDEAILAMTDDNLRHREKILSMEKAQSLRAIIPSIIITSATLITVDMMLTALQLSSIARIATKHGSIVRNSPTHHYAQTAGLFLPYIVKFSCHPSDSARAHRAPVQNNRA